MSSTSTHLTLVATHSKDSGSSAQMVPQMVINTRPVERAAPLTQHLRAAGLTVVDIPMLTLQPRPITDMDIAIMRQWLAGEYKALVIVSPTAAAAGLSVWKSIECEYTEHKGSVNSGNDKSIKKLPENLSTPSHLIAVGEATAAEFDRAKTDTTRYQVLQPEIANNEGMLAMPEIDSLQAGDKVLIWRGLGGRRLLVNTLQARGVHIDSIAWYERTMPIDAMAQYQQWQQELLTHNLSSDIALQQSKPIVVISSAAAFENWSSIVKDTQPKPLEKRQGAQSVDNTGLKLLTEQALPLTLEDFSYVVLGERLANMVATQQLNYWRVENLTPETILAAITSNL